MSQNSLKRNDLGRLSSSLPELRFSLSAVRAAIERLGVTELRRRFFHMAPALLPVALPFVQHRDVWGPILISLASLSTALGLTLAVTLRHFLKRPGEKQWVSAVMGYVIPVVTPLLIFPGRAEFGLMTLQIVAMGDGLATFGGLIFGGRKLPWNSDKTYSGLICFVIAGGLASTYSYWGEVNPTISIGTAFSICGIATLCAGIVESLPIRSNDNFRVGLTGLVAGLVMSHILASG